MSLMQSPNLPVHIQNLNGREMLIQFRQSLRDAQRTGRWSAWIWILALVPGSYFAITNYLQHALITGWFGAVPFAILAAVAFFLCYNTYSVVVRAQWFLTASSFRSKIRIDAQAIIHVAMVLIASSIHLFLISVLTAVSRSYGNWTPQIIPYFTEIWVSCIPIWILLYLATLGACKYLQTSPATKSVGQEPTKSPATLPRLSIRDKGIIHYVEPRSIRQIVADGDYVKLHTADQVLMPKGSISKFEETLKPHGPFLRVHRSCLVQADCIKSLNRTESGAYRVELDDGSHVPLSRRKIGLVRDVLNGPADKHR